MSDDPTTDAEIISAYLDGEATPAEVARVRADPSLLAAVAELEALREQLALDRPPAGLVDRQVGVALAAFDHEGAEGRPAGAAVTDLATHRRPVLRRLPLGAVAAAVVLVALVGALTQLDTGDDDASDQTAALDTTSGGDDAAEESDEAGEALSAPEAAADGSAGAGASPPAFLAFTDTDDLARHLATRVAESATRDQPADEDLSATGTDATQEREVDPCDAVAVAGVDRSTVVLVLPAVVGGAPVTAVVTESGDGERRLVVVDDASCTVIDDRPL